MRGFDEMCKNFGKSWEGLDGKAREGRSRNFGRKNTRIVKAKKGTHSVLRRHTSKQIVKAREGKISGIGSRSGFSGKKKLIGKARNGRNPAWLRPKIRCL